MFNAAAEVQLPFIRITSGPLQGAFDLHGISPGPRAELAVTDLVWSEASNVTVGGVGNKGQWDYYSAICWLMLRTLADLNAAVGAAEPLGGIVQCYGGTSIQWWSSASALAMCDLAHNPGSACCQYGGNASCLYDTQIAPYAFGTRFAAVLWYQGEMSVAASPLGRGARPSPPISTHLHPTPTLPPPTPHSPPGEQNANCGGPAQIGYYSCALPALINDWRASFGSTMPFGIFLLAPWQAGTDASFALLRLAQVATAVALPRVFTASTLDAGDPAGGPVHSPYKRPGSERAAAALRALLYGDAASVYLGPRAAAVAASGVGPSAIAATITFTAESLAGGALALNTSVRCPAGVTAVSCESFAVQTAPDCLWRSVEVPGAGAALAPSASGAVLTLTLTGAPAGARIVAVRGLYASYPIMQLRNAAGVPTEPWLMNVTGVTNACPPLAAPAWVDTGAHA